MRLDLTFRARLALLAASGVAGALIVGAIGMVGQHRLSSLADEEARLADARQAQMFADMMHDAVRGEVVTTLLAAAHGDAAGVESGRRALDARGRELRGAVDTLARLPLDPESRDAVNSVRTPLDEYVREGVATTALAAQDAQAGNARLPRFAERFDALETAMARVSDRMDKVSTALDARRAAVGTAVVRAQWIALLLVAAALVVLSWRMIRTLVGALGEANRVADAVAGGAFETRPPPTGRDEIAQLLRAMQRMQDVLSGFTEAQLDMARRHAEGDIDHRLDASRFPGAYGAMATQVNDVVRAHVETTVQLVEHVGAYVRGDLEREMPRLPPARRRASPRPPTPCARAWRSSRMKSRCSSTTRSKAISPRAATPATATSLNASTA